MKKTRSNVPTSSAMYAARPRSCTWKRPPRRPEQTPHGCEAAPVQRPLASVIARDRDEIQTPADLADKTVGVTGVPSDDAVLDTVLRADGVAPDDVRRVTIGFNAVAQLAAGRIDAATAFWNAEGVQLKRLGIPTREFRVDEFGAPRYPELVLVARDERLAEEMGSALASGYDLLADRPEAALDDLIA